MKNLTLYDAGGNPFDIDALSALAKLLWFCFILVGSSISKLVDLFSGGDLVLICEDCLNPLTRQAQ